MIWATKEPTLKYKRHDGDGSFKCPVCHHNHNWSTKRWLTTYSQGYVDICCTKCGITSRFDRKERVLKVFDMGENKEEIKKVQKSDLKPGTIIKTNPLSPFSYIYTDEKTLVCLETGKVMKDKPETVEGSMYMPVYPVQHTDIFSQMEEDLDREEKQLIYDALINKYFHDLDMERSEHPAKSYFKRNSEIAWALISRIRNKWKWDVLH